MTVSSRLRVCACERGHTLAAACSSHNPKTALLRCFGVCNAIALQL